MTDLPPELDPDARGFADETAAEPSPRPPTKVPGVWKQIPLAVKFLLVVLVLVAAGGVVVANRLTNESTAQLGNGTIEQLIPNNGDKILQQDQIGIRLASGYTADLSVNGTPLPADQVTQVAALNEVLFQPGQGKVFEQWPAGQNCVVATYWKYETPGQTDTHTWCFSVV